VVFCPQSSQLTSAPAANGASISDAMPRLLEDAVWESVAFQDHTLSA
jgi:hypothetical protein